MYADDTQLYGSCIIKDLNQLSLKMQSCIEDIKSWMTTNKLKLNEEKTEILCCSTNKTVTKVPLNEFHVAEQKIDFSVKAKNLGVLFDEKLTMNDHVNYMSKCIHFELRKIGQLCTILDPNSIKTLVCAFVFSRLDYCNALLAGLPDNIINKLQRTQNQAARIVLKRKYRDHVTPMFIELHWLPVRARITYKIAISAYKCFYGLAPPYLSSMLDLYSPTRALRSSNDLLFFTPQVKYKTIGERSFSFYAPKVWNNLPFKLRNIQSLHIFKRHLKTHLFNEYLLV